MESYIQNTNNRSLISLAYKIIDNIPNTTLFGGIVREIIAPSVISQQNPFELKYQNEYSLPDIDIIYEIKKNSQESKKSILKSEIDSKFKIKFREWDWFITEIEDLKVYQTTGCRIFIENQILGIVRHIDLIVEPENIQDFDVNNLRFNKKKGLFHIETLTSKSIGSHIFSSSHFFQVLDSIKTKKCQIISNLIINDSGRNILLIRRFIKMLKKGWNITNKNNIITINNINRQKSICMICHNEPENIHCELTCSKCHLCFDCLEHLLVQMDFTKNTFKCPTCRIEIRPWFLN